MSKAFFKEQEHSTNPVINLERFLPELTFNKQGLIPVIVQEHATKSILMFAWMNANTLQQTIDTQRMCYWSRSRNKVWIKGEESGHFQMLKCLKADCDGDVLLAEVDQVGSACHTHRKSCFYWTLNSTEAVRDEE